MISANQELVSSLPFTPPYFTSTRPMYQRQVWQDCEGENSWLLGAKAMSGSSLLFPSLGQDLCLLHQCILYGYLVVPAPSNLGKWSLRAKWSVADIWLTNSRGTGRKQSRFLSPPSMQTWIWWFLGTPTLALPSSCSDQKQALPTNRVVQESHLLSTIIACILKSKCSLFLTVLCYLQWQESPSYYMGYRHMTGCFIYELGTRSKKNPII